MEAIVNCWPAELPRPNARRVDFSERRDLVAKAASSTVVAPPRYELSRDLAHNADAMDLYDGGGIVIVLELGDAVRLPTNRFGELFLRQTRVSTRSADTATDVGVRAPTWRETPTD